MDVVYGCKGNLSDDTELDCKMVFKYIMEKANVIEKPS